MKKLTVQTNNNEVTISMYDEIGSDYITDSDISGLLVQHDGAGKTIHLRINSPGGDVFMGNAIYNLLKNAKATIYTYIDGVAASMSSLILLTGKKVFMAENAMLMIHNPKVKGSGESKDLRRQAEILDKLKSTMLRVYSAKTGLPENQIEQMMNEETWMNADEALARGFVDEITTKTLEVKTPVRSGNQTPENLYACYSCNPSVTSFNPSNRENWTYEMWAENDSEGFVNLMKSEPNKAQSLLDNHYGKGQVVVERNASSSKPIQQGRENWTYEDWAEKDEEGFKELMKNNPKEAQRLLDNHYGK